MSSSGWLINFAGTHGEPIWLWYAASAVFGLCLGSFLNVCIWRMPRHESVVTTSSHCPKCDHALSWYENIPVISYLALGGKCRKCREPISARYITVELLTATLLTCWLAVSGSFQDTPAAFAPGVAIILLSIVTFFTDLNDGVIPDAATLPALGAGLLLGALLPENYQAGTWYFGLLSAASMPLAVFVVLGLFKLVTGRLFKTETFGWGDVKFIAALGALSGVYGVLFTLFAASLAGFFGGMIYAAVKRRALTRATVPFGPFMAFFAVLWVYAGSSIFNGYLALVKSIFVR